MRLPPNLIALIGVNIALAAAAGLVAWVPAHYEARLETLIRPIPMPNSPPTIPPATAANVQAMRNAPMFYQARAIVVVEDPALIMATRPDYILAAAMILPQGHSTAYLKPPEPGTTAIRVRIGDDLGGWTVSVIEPRRVVAVRKALSVEIVPLAKPDAQGLTRVAMTPLPRSGGIRTLGATGNRPTTLGDVPREARLYRPPPPR